MPAGAVHSNPVHASRYLRTRPRLPEEHVERLWRREAVAGACFTTTAGERVTIISIGVRNQYDGPDFLGCRIRIGGGERTGGLEIHCFEDDWVRHGHRLDPRYRDVALHVVLYASDRGPRTAIPTIALTEVVPHAVALCLDPSVLGPAPAIPCAMETGRVSRDVIHAALHLAAVERFNRKTVAIRERRRALAIFLAPAAAWRQTFWELAARALGYGGNETLLETLARDFPIDSLRDCETDEIRAKFEVETMRAGMQGVGNARGVRPGNRQCVRLGQMARLAQRISDTHGWNTLVRLGRGGAIGDILEFFRPVFTEGRGTPDRLREILVNVCAPFLMARSIATRDAAMGATARRMYFSFSPMPSNRRIRGCSAVFPLPERLSSAIQQGVIELTTRYCADRRCGECLIGYCAYH